VEVMQNIAPDDATRMLADQFRPGRLLLPEPWDQAFGG
jgi:hypothetical protein